jgi:hypothetical protein
MMTQPLFEDGRDKALKRALSFLTAAPNLIKPQDTGEKAAAELITLAEKLDAYLHEPMK